MLRDYQKKALNKACAFIKEHPGESGYIKAPCRSGKSWMISLLADYLAQQGNIVAVLAHSEKLVGQNYEKSPNKDICGIYCSGLNREELDKQITFATIQSIANKIINPNFIIVDECDMVHPDEDSNTQYRHFFRINGNPPVLGFTATDYRSKGGIIEWGHLIHEIPLRPLIEAGYVVPPVMKASGSPKLDDIKITAGEYNGKQLNELYTDKDLLKFSIERILYYGQERNRPLVFSQNVNHGKILTENLNANGMNSIFVDGNTPKDDLRKIFELHEQGIYKAVVNCQLCTVGYDLPWVDMVAIVRSTNSKRLFEQMAWRPGTPYPGKENFMLLDLGGNLERHGPLGSPYREKAKREKSEKAPGKICPECEEYVDFGSMQCSGCGFEFPEPVQAKINHSDEEAAGIDPVYKPQSEQWFDVHRVDYLKGTTKKGDNCIIAKYHVTGWPYPTMRQWHMPHHAKDFPRQKFHAYYKAMGDDIYGGPEGLESYTIDDLLWRAENKFTKKVIKILVDISGDFPEIKSYQFESDNISTEELLDDEIAFTFN